jgi:hypothetical protein
LIRLEELRPKGLPAGAGISSENLAHRIAIRYPSDEGLADGVFIWRRETDRALVALLGGRLFPGVHDRARFDVRESGGGLSYDVRSHHGDSDVALRVRSVDEWEPTRLFRAFDDVRSFFERGDCGFSCSLKGDSLEGIRLRSLAWDMSPLAVDEVHSAFYSDRERFPSGSIGLDGAVLMRGVPHEWHELADVPEMATVLR